MSNSNLSSLNNHSSFNNSKSLSLITALKSDRDFAVAIDSSGETVSYQVFLTHISAYQSAIENVIGAEKGKKFAIYFEDSYQFLAAFCAVLISGNYIVMPGNNLQGTCENLLTSIDGFIGDFSEKFVEDSVLIKNISFKNIKQQRVEIDTGLILQDAPVVSLYTSGSSGTPKLVAKSLQQIEAEVNTLEQLWGDQIGHSVIVGSVSHQHIYGLLFRLIWPLLSGRTIYSEILTYPEELHGVVASLGSSVLVSSPTQLSRFPESVGWDILQGKVKAVFSSGAPLKKEHSLNVNNHLNVGVIEVLGSTETGGIAYKCEDGSEDIYWTAFPNVEITKDQTTGTMQLISAHFPNRNLYKTTDKIEFTPNGKGFVLQGRTDRIVKIEGKRLSLDEMETVLLKHPLLSACRIVTITETREIIAVAAILTAKGKDFLVDKGKFKLNKEFTAFLRGSFENVLMPRKWRYVNELPVNAQGKFEYTKLKELFNDGDKPKFPEVVESDIDGDKATLQIYVPNDIYYFGGHFPGTSILAGVVQLTWAAYFAKEYFQVDVVSKQLDAIKFQNVITPGSNVFLDLTFNREKSNVAFKYYSREELASEEQSTKEQPSEIQFSSGRIKLEQPE